MALLQGNLLLDYHLLAYDVLDSTNEEAKRLIRGGAVHGAVVWAKKQTQGRGRYGRTWVSQPGNLYTSFVLQPSCSAERLPELSFVAALTAQETIAQVLPDSAEVTCKWPNDILINDRKVGGILLESFMHEGRLWVVVGIGINVENYPTDTQFPATCLKEEGVELISAKIVLSRFIHHFIERYNAWEKKGFSPVRNAWQKVAWRLGDPIRVALAHEEVEGLFKGIERDGSLILQLGPKTKRVIQTGDVFAATTPLPLPPDNNQGLSDVADD